MSLPTQSDARSRPRWRRRLLIAGDAALALALAALSVALTVTLPPGLTGSDPAAGIALALLQTLPLALRRWRPVWVLAIVVTATLAAKITREGGAPGPVVLLVALYSVARTVRGGRQPGRASPPGPSWSCRFCAMVAVWAASSPLGRSP